MKHMGTGTKPKQTQSGWEKIVAGVKNYLSGRATTNISLLMVRIYLSSYPYVLNTPHTAPRHYSDIILHDVFSLQP